MDNEAIEEIFAGVPMTELDPFIQNLDLFFPDSGAELAQASDPFADPSAGNRAEPIGRWWLDSGTELNYVLGESHQLFSTDSTAFQSNDRSKTQAGAPSGARICENSTPSL